MGKHRKNTRIKNWGVPSARLSATWASPIAAPPQGPSRETLRKLADRASEFFSPLGALVELTADDVLLNGEPIYRHAADTTSTIDSVGLARYSESLEHAAAVEIVTRMPGTHTEFRGSSLDVFRDGQRVLWIRPTHAVVEGAVGPQITGNFMLPGGQHWEELSRRVGVTSDLTVLTELPGVASLDQHARAIAASTIIRERRRRSFERAIVTIMSRTTAGRYIVFNPPPRSGAIEAPFSFSDGGQTINGALRLSTPGGVLALALTERPAEDDLLIAAWLYSLESFEYLTCAIERGEEEQRKSGPGVAPETSQQPETDGGELERIGPAPRRLRSVQPRSDTSLARLPAGLEPSTSTLHSLPLYVADYTRRLPDGQHHSEDARVGAARAGIVLRPEETWVTGYWRGPGQVAHLEFTWADASPAAQPTQRAA